MSKVATAQLQGGRRRTVRCVAALSLTAAFGCSAQSADPAPVPGQLGAVSPVDNAGKAPARAWSLRVPSAEKVVFRGAVNYDAAGLGEGSFLYPAPNAAGLLVAIVAHGLISSGMRQDQKNRMQVEADRVLQPFEPVLVEFTNRQLMEAGVQKMQSGGRKRLLAATDPAGADWLIESAPVFAMTQDQSALVLENAVRIVEPGTLKVAYAKSIRVISAPLTAPASPVASQDTAPSGVVAMWLDSQGRRLTEESVALFAESMDIALADAISPLGDDKVAQKTFRYPEGGSQKMERAQMVVERCGRTLVRTLRGGLMSIPTDSEGTPSRCATPAAAP